ncbi:monocarboxylate transporter 12-like [Strongylocentrotus purpuratus]|uniref:Monocarboxylate transporter n=1 Tax=Strongylocentrotus purpuratus TaxID=7668 RepID=A0A7M7NBT5_STRPU|nr:monocarboxylate transporter 12-like [Strongylocentrotus purpuratus]
MAWCSSIVGSPCFPVVLILIMESCSKIGLVKAMGILFGHLSRSIQMSSTDLGIALGLFYTVGLLSRAGYCALRMTCITALHRLAGENFNLLFSLSTCGYAAGMVLFPFLADELLTAYDWRGVLLILGGVMLNIIPCALAIRITPEDFTPRDYEGLQRRLEQVESDTISIAGSVRSCSDAERDNDRDDAVKDTDRDDAVKDTDMTPLLTSSARHDRYVRIDADHPSPDNEIPHKNRLAYINGIPGKISSWFRSMGFYDDPFSLFIFLSIDTLFFVYNGWHDFLLPHALQRGISQHDTIIITFVAAVGNLSIRLIIACLTHKLVDPVNIYLVLTIVNIISLTCDAFLPHYYVMLVTSFCSVAAIAGRAVLGILIIRNRVSPENVPMALSVNNLVEASGFFLGGYLSGFVADKFSSYDATFKLLALVDVLTFIFMLFPKIVKKPEMSSDVET